MTVRNRSTKSRSWQIAVPAALLLAAMGSAQSLPIADSFSYGAGAVESVSGTWTADGGNLGNPFQIVSTAGDSGSSLAYPGLLSGGGNRMVCTYGADRGAIYRTFDQVSAAGSSVYVSCLLKVTTAPNPFSSTFVQFRDPSFLNIRCSVHLQQSANAGFFNVGLRHAGTGTIQWLSTDYPLNQTVFLVARTSLVSGANNDVSSLWVNPTPGSGSPPAANATATNASQSDVALGVVAFATGIGASGVHQVDELRVGTNWTDVAPAGSAVQDWTAY